MMPLNEATSLPLHLIISDHQLPGTGSWEATKQMRSESRFDQIALADYSSHLTAVMERNCFDACFFKVVTMEEVPGNGKAFCKAAERRMA
jgi:CheY-like chemotaxis protein